MRTKFFKLCLLISLSGWCSFSSAQLSAESIAATIATDSGGPVDNYIRYGEKLMTTLGYLTPSQLERVFGTPTSLEFPGSNSGNGDGTTTVGGGNTTGGGSDSNPEDGTGAPTLNDQLELEDIGFKSGSANLSDASKRELDKVHMYPEKNPEAKIKN